MEGDGEGGLNGRGGGWCRDESLEDEDLPTLLPGDNYIIYFTNMINTKLTIFFLMMTIFFILIFG